MEENAPLNDDSLLLYGKKHKNTPLGEVPDKYLWWLYDTIGSDVDKTQPGLYDYLVDYIDSIKKNIQR